jgi:hypothetical protein
VNMYGITDSKQKSAAVSDAQVSAGRTQSTQLISFHEFDPKLRPPDEFSGSGSGSSGSASNRKSTSSSMFSKLMRHMRTTFNHATGSGSTYESHSTSSKPDVSNTMVRPRNSFSRNRNLPDVVEEEYEEDSDDSMSERSAQSMAQRHTTPDTTQANTAGSSNNVSGMAPRTLITLDQDVAYDDVSQDGGQKQQPSGYANLGASFSNMSGSLIHSGIKAMTGRHADASSMHPSASNSTTSLANTLVATPTATVTPVIAPADITTSIDASNNQRNPHSLYNMPASSTTSLAGDFDDAGLALNNGDDGFLAVGTPTLLRPTSLSAPMGRTLSASKRLRRVRGEGMSRQHWIKDEDAKTCFGCNLQFTTLVRRHHCRMCGK